MDAVLKVVCVDSVDSDSDEQDSVLDVDCVETSAPPASRLLVLSSSDGGLRDGYDGLRGGMPPGRHSSSSSQIGQAAEAGQSRLSVKWPTLEI